MKQLFKRWIKGTALQKWIKKRKNDKKLAEWQSKGKPVPPPHIVKQLAIRNYARRFGLKILVETGTLHGRMIEAMKDDFDRIYSIELSEELYKKAKDRFRKENSVELIHGDSGVELKHVIERLDQPALFWLDGHYSSGETARGEKDTPVFEELNHIFDDQVRDHVIIIDDARCFGTDPAYPTLEELTNFVKSRRPGAGISIQDDSIRITPRP